MGDLSWEGGDTIPFPKMIFFKTLPTHKKLHFTGEPYRFRNNRVLWLRHTDKHHIITFEYRICKGGKILQFHYS